MDRSNYSVAQTTLMKCVAFFVYSMLVLGLMLSADEAFAQKRVMTYYDSAGPEGWMGELYAQHLVNLLSHFEATALTKPVEQYEAGEMAGYDQVFYLGMVYDNALPAAFLNDALSSNAKLCWIGYNLHQIAMGSTEYSARFKARFGFSFLRLGAHVWSTVQYRGVTLGRATEPDIGIVKILSPDLVETLATAHAGSNETPYVVKSGSFHYVADNPMSYVTWTDRNLAFADALHDILGADHAQTHLAVLRIEDVYPLADPEKLRAIADYLSSEGVPFAVSVIPEYRDPTGLYNEGAPQSVTWQDVPPALDALRYMARRGGQIVQHGWTHQYESTNNPFSGISGEDWEFFRVELDGSDPVFVGPVPEDSFEWAYDRVDRGKRELVAAGLPPVAWLTPHYLASPTDYLAFASHYRISLDRGVYFSEGEDGTSYFAEQMAPYILPRDVYGIKRIPETCGHVNPPSILPADLITRAQANLAVRDGWAGCYFHWYLDLDYLKEVVAGIKALGYRFVPPAPPRSVTPALRLLLTGGGH